MFLQAGTFTSNVNSSQPISISGTAASFGGSGMSTFERSSAIGPVFSLKSTVSLYAPASPRPTA
jgi:hypothetical protein